MKFLIVAENFLQVFMNLIFHGRCKLAIFVWGVKEWKILCLYLSPGLGLNFFCTLLACLFLGFTESLCFCAELSNKDDLVLSPTAASSSGSGLCFLCKIWEVKFWLWNFVNCFYVSYKIFIFVHHTRDM